jgi:ATP-dependent DNA helicase RecQ
LIAFVYDTVERARRRSLREMWLAARESKTDGELRTRILDYLSEGDVAPVLMRLAEEEQLRLPAWADALEGITSDHDAREWRGSAARLLGSYPDHPGLLLARAMSELVDSAGAAAEGSSALKSFLNSSLSRYGVPESELTESLKWATAFCLRRSRPDAAAVVAAVAEPHFDVWSELDLTLCSQAPALAVVHLERRLRLAVETLEQHAREEIS